MSFDRQILLLLLLVRVAQRILLPERFFLLKKMRILMKRRVKDNKHTHTKIKKNPKKEKKKSVEHGQ